MTLGHWVIIHWSMKTLITFWSKIFSSYNIFFFSCNVFRLYTDQKQLLFPCQNREVASEMICCLLYFKRSLLLSTTAIPYYTINSVTKSHMSICERFKFTLALSMNFSLSLFFIWQKPQIKRVYCLHLLSFTALPT